MSGDERMDCGAAKDFEPQVFNPKTHVLDPEEKLEMDESAYIMYHAMTVEHSCLSFDIIRDNLGSGTERSEVYPYCLTAISGSQAASGHNNMLTVMKMSNLDKIKQKDNENDDSEDDSDEESDMLDDETELVYANISHNGAVNRVRSTQINGQTFAASWSELGQVYVWDLTKPIWAVNDSAYMADYLSSKDLLAPSYTLRSHTSEGYALDWSPCVEGSLVSGDNDGGVFVTMLKETGTGASTKAAQQHRSSVEDLQWSPNQAHIFASCSSDRSIVIWDTRDMCGHVTVPNAHASDINVIAWNRSNAVSLLSGGDDGLVRLWDLRMVRSAAPERACTHVYDYHSNCAITSVEWCPGSQYVFACSSEDDQLTLWDVSMEQDEESGPDDGEYPVQMLFNHMGQKEIKELHWHPQIPGLLFSTALDGFNVFRTISV